jgi:hypothetical protein
VAMKSKSAFEWLKEFGGIFQELGNFTWIQTKTTINGQ